MEGAEDGVKTVAGEVVHQEDAQAEEVTGAPAELDEAGDDMAEDPQSPEGEAVATDAALHPTAEAAAEEPPALSYDTLGPEHLGLREFVADDSRPHLAAICVRGGKAAVTNGGVLVEVPTRRIDQSELPRIDGMGTPLAEDQEVLLPPAALEKALRLVDKKASVAALQRVVLSNAPAANGEGPKVLLSAADLETSGTIAVRPISGKFPTYAQVIPSKAGRTRIRLDAARVKALAGYIERHGRTGPMTLYFDPQSELAPVLVEFGEQNECLAVLAPVRVYG